MGDAAFRLTGHGFVAYRRIGKAKLDGRLNQDRSISRLVRMPESPGIKVRWLMAIATASRLSVAVF